MDNLTIKKEKATIDGYDISDTLSEINDILEVVKREENVSSDEEGPSATVPVTESCIEELFKDESEDENSSPESHENEEIQRLQELLEKRKRELKESTKARSGSPSDRKKRKGIRQEGGDTISADRQAKRKRADESLRPGSRSPASDRRESGATSSKLQTKKKSVDASTNSSNNEQQSSIANETSASTDVILPTTEIEQLLKTDDYNSDGETPSSHEEIPSTSFAPQTPYVYPPAIQIGATIYGGGNQMMGNVQPVDYPLIYNMAVQPPFYQNIGNMPMMGYGLPQMGLPVNQDEVECLPVVNEAGFSGMPTFKRIKLERNPPTSSENADISAGESPEDRRSKVFETCTTLLQHLEFAEPTGKFTHTSTVTKINPDSASNSIVQKISNVSYEFHSIGPKLNLANWGLKEISSRNAGIAKKIAISAEKYFAKIAEKANTMARQLIKVENAKVERNLDEMEIEIEEPTLSTFLKNSMTQTDPLICRDCAARKRIVGHDIGVQATVYTGSIGSQTSPIVSENDRLSAGLSSNQLKALYEFSHMIREPSKNTTVELFKLREKLMDVYNLSQRPNIGPVPKVPSLVDPFPTNPASHLRSNMPSTRDPRYDNCSNSDSRRFMPPGMSVQRHSTLAIQAPMPSAMKIPNYQPNSMQAPVGQYPGHQRSLPDPRYAAAPLQDIRNYGRGTPRQ